MNDVTIYPEVACAAKWWADQLRGDPMHDAGDAMMNAMAAWASGRISRLSEADILRFEQELETVLQAYVIKKGWHPDRPGWGNRDVGTDYHPDGTLDQAAQAAGLGDLSLQLPYKTMMWVNPGSVTVSRGYRAPVVEIFHE